MKAAKVAKRTISVFMLGPCLSTEVNLSKCIADSGHRSGLIKAARSLDQHVRAHEKAEGVLLPLILNDAIRGDVHVGHFGWSLDEYKMGLGGTVRRNR